MLARLFGCLFGRRRNAAARKRDMFRSKTPSSGLECVPLTKNPKDARACEAAAAATPPLPTITSISCCELPCKPCAVVLVNGGTLIVVADPREHALFMFDAATGGLRRRVGSQGFERGYFGCPTCIAATDRNTLLVGEFANRRVQEVDLSGAHVATVDFGHQVTAVAYHTGVLAVGWFANPQAPLHGVGSMVLLESRHVLGTFGSIWSGSSAVSECVAAQFSACGRCVWTIERAGRRGFRLASFSRTGNPCQTLIDTVDHTFSWLCAMGPCLLVGDGVTGDVHCFEPDPDAPRRSYEQLRKSHVWCWDAITAGPMQLHKPARAAFAIAPHGASGYATLRLAFVDSGPSPRIQIRDGPHYSDTSSS